MSKPFFERIPKGEAPLGSLEPGETFMDSGLLYQRTDHTREDRMIACVRMRDGALHFYPAGQEVLHMEVKITPRRWQDK